MKTREKKLTGIAGVMLLGIVAWLATQHLVLSPSRKLDNEIAQLSRRVSRLRVEAEQTAADGAKLKHWARRTIGSDAVIASEQVRIRLTHLIELTGIGSDALSLTPVAGNGVNHAYREVGWIIHTRGKTDRVVDLLYLLEAEPYLRRIDQLTIEPAGRTEQLNVRLRFSALMIESEQAGMALDADPALKAEARSKYQVIAERRLFAAASKPKPTPKARRLPPRPRKADKEGSLKVVGLPAWEGRPEVYVFNLRSKQLMRLEPGDELAAGVVVKVDYTPKARPNQPDMLSHSRVVLRIDDAYWTIELGDTLAEKQRIDGIDLPDIARKESDAPTPQ